MQVLILGGGGREHAIADSLARSPRVEKLYVAPGNGGTAAIAENVDLNFEDPAYVVDFAEAKKIDLVVVGPEVPLVSGVVDMLSISGISAFGPGAAAAQIEGSKQFAKELMTRAGIPTGKGAAFWETPEALTYAEKLGTPLVVKADGLAAGKGVVIANDMDEVRKAVAACFDGEFGAAGDTVLIEEFLTGQECSLLAFVDGTTVLPMTPAQDHKRALDNDEGPNTGGMGVYSPVPVVTEAEHAAMVDILERAARQMAEEGTPYSGVLYGGFILTDEGPKVLEFNARFGDPEAQVVLPRLKTDLLEVLLATVEGRLGEMTLEWTEEVALSVVLASGGYPGSYIKGKTITGIDAAEKIKGVKVFHAGTALENGELVTSGGRVLNVTAVAFTFQEARDRAYQAVERISFEDMHYRTDIGLRAIAAGRQED